MKSDIPFDQFEKVVIALAEHFKKKSEENSKELEKTLRQIFDGS